MITAVIDADVTNPPRVAVAVPLRGFAGAKSRLAPALSPVERESAARQWATTVMDAAFPHAAFVVTDDPDVDRWARGRGAGVIVPPEPGLDAAAAAAFAHLAALDFDAVVIAHGDLPLAESFTAVLPRHSEIVVVPDRRRDGTNVIALPTDIAFEFSYGPGSFGRHLRRAAASGRAVRTVDDSPLAFDVDDPVDLDELP